MKKVLSFLVIFLICTFLCTSVVFAHIAGQPPFFKMNGVYTPLYQAPLSNFPEILVPQDAAPQTYLVNDEITFELEPANMGVADFIVKATIFRWNLGDGTQLTGIKNTHRYTKPGSYFLTVSADYRDSSEPILLQSTLITILPSADFKPPSAQMKINGQLVTDPVNQILTFNYTRPLTFEIAANSEISSVLWDFGDQASGSGTKVTHQYDAQLGGTVFPIAQINFKNNFMQHQYVQVDKNNALPETMSTPASESAKNSSGWLRTVGALGVSVLVFVSVGYLLLRKKRQHSPE